MVSNLGKSLENSMNKKYEKGIEKGIEKGVATGVDSSITILKLLKENKNISEIAKITGVKEDKIKEIASLLLNQ